MPKIDDLLSFAGMEDCLLIPRARNYSSGMQVAFGPFP